MSQPLLAYNVWLSTPIETRVKLTKLFGIPRTGEVIVQTGEIQNGNIGSIVKSDGHSAGDLYAITVEKMQALLNTDDTDFYKMFNHIVENIDYMLPPSQLIATKADGTKEIYISKYAPSPEQVKEIKNFATLMEAKPKKNAKKKEQI